MTRAESGRRRRRRRGGRDLGERPGREGDADVGAEPVRSSTAKATAIGARFVPRNEIARAETSRRKFVRPAPRPASERASASRPRPPAEQPAAGCEARHARSARIFVGRPFMRRPDRDLLDDEAFRRLTSRAETPPASRATAGRHFVGSVWVGFEPAATSANPPARVREYVAPDGSARRDTGRRSLSHCRPGSMRACGCTSARSPARLPMPSESRTGAGRE